jgi:hypothetical protein
MINISSIFTVSSVQTFRTINFSVDQRIPHVLLALLTIYLFRTSSKAVLSVCVFYTFLTSESTLSFFRSHRQDLTEKQTSWGIIHSKDFVITYLNWILKHFRYSIGPVAKTKGWPVRTDSKSFSKPLG